MKNYRLLFIMMAAVMFAVSCTEEEAFVDDLSTKKAVTMSEDDWPSVEDFCGSVMYHELIGGQTILMGTVAVGNDGTNLYVKYQADSGYVITETHLFVGEIDNMPAGKKGNPKIGHFPYKWENQKGSVTVVHTIPLNEIGDCFDIAAHAVVESPNGDYEETAWGAGRIENDIVFASKSSFRLPDGRSWHASTEGIYYADNCHWGFYFGYNILDLVNFSPKTVSMYDFEGSELGTVSVDIVNSELVFTIEGVNGNELRFPHLFVGELNDLFALTVDDCPDYENFPYQEAIVKIPLSQFESESTNSALKFEGNRWGFYFNYCVVCN